MTLNEQIEIIDRLIEDFRWARPHPEVDEHQTYQVLKTIAVDLRGRLGSAPSIAEHELEKRIEGVKAGKTATGYPANGMIELAQELIGRWPTVKQALTMFNAMAEEER